MTRFPASLTLEEFAAAVCEGLKQSGIEAVLTGGAVVMVYSQGKYVSSDADFITPADDSEIEAAMTKMGFKRNGKDYFPPEGEFSVEFPGRTIQIGKETIREWTKRSTKTGVLLLLRPTECVMDRLAAFYHWTDRQSLAQAVMVAKANPIDLKRVEAWSRREGQHGKFLEFQKSLHRSK